MDYMGLYGLWAERRGYHVSIQILSQIMIRDFLPESVGKTENDVLRQYDKKGCVILLYIYFLGGNV